MAAALAAASLCACGGGGGSHAPAAATATASHGEDEQSADPAGAVPTSALPVWAVGACVSIRWLAPFCADRGPPGHSDVWEMEAGADPRHRVSYVVLRRGVQGAGAAPPQAGSLVEAAAPASSAPSTFHLSPGVRRPVSRWSQTPGTALDGGRQRWGGLSGRVFLLPATHDEFTDLVAFTWLDGSRRRLVAVGAWSPFAEAVATLRAIVTALPRGQRAAPALVPAAPIAGVAMVRTPRWVRQLCRQEVRSGCPAELPSPRSRFEIVQVTPLRHGRGAAAGPTHSVDVAWGANSGSTHADRPPALVHLIVSNGDRPASRAPVSHVDLATLLRSRYPPHPVVLGHPHWTREPGTLSLGDCFNDHVCYRWTSGGRHRLVSIHAWSPLTQTLRVFARVVRSTGAR